MRILIFLLGFALQVGYGQQSLPLTFSHYYSLTDEPLPKELIRYPTDEIGKKIEAILDAGKAQQNFELIACNVSSIVVARNGNSRYLLYNPDFLAGQSQDILATMSLAVAVGYHVNEHSLFPRSEAQRIERSAAAQARFEAESLEASRFAGFALYYLENITSDQIIRIVYLWKILSTIPPSDLMEAMQAGYKKAAALILLGPSAAFVDLGDGQSLPGIPEFPFPPPMASGTLDLSNYFRGVQKLGSIADRLEESLANSRYYERQYYYVHGGFALVTRIEQYQEDGTSHSEPGRWAAKPYREEGSWWDYLSSLFTDNPGRFRIFVFMVTNTPLVSDTSRKITRQTAEAWLNEGASSLPLRIRQMPKSDSTSVSVLVYDFLTSSGTGETQLVQPSLLPSLIHLEKSNLLTYIRP
jgi:hypothetical protein